MRPSRARHQPQISICAYILYYMQTYQAIFAEYICDVGAAMRTITYRSANNVYRARARNEAHKKERPFKYKPIVTLNVNCRLIVICDLYLYTRSFVRQGCGDWGIPECVWTVTFAGNSHYKLILNKRRLFAIKSWLGVYAQYILDTFADQKKVQLQEELANDLLYTPKPHVEDGVCISPFLLTRTHLYLPFTQAARFTC